MHTFSIHVCVESLPQTPHIRPSSPTALPLFRSLFLSLSLSLVRALSLSQSHSHSPAAAAEWRAEQEENFPWRLTLAPCLTRRKTRSKCPAKAAA